MGLFQSRRDRNKGEDVLAATADAFRRKMPLYKRILREMQHDLIEWERDGRMVRGRATGEIFGVEAEPLMIGHARFVLEPSGEEVWEYPTKVLADGGHLVGTPRQLPSLLDFMAEDSD